METKVLEMMFINSLGKKYTISVNDPKDDLTEAEIRSVMEEIVAKNIFITTGGDLVAVSGARIITKQVDKIYED